MSFENPFGSAQMPTKAEDAPINDVTPDQLGPVMADTIKERMGLDAMLANAQPGDAIEATVWYELATAPRTYGELTLETSKEEFEQQLRTALSMKTNELQLGRNVELSKLEASIHIIKAEEVSKPEKDTRKFSASKRMRLIG